MRITLLVLFVALGLGSFSGCGTAESPPAQVQDQELPPTPDAAKTHETTQ